MAAARRRPAAAMCSTQLRGLVDVEVDAERQDVERQELEAVAARRQHRAPLVDRFEQADGRRHELGQLGQRSEQLDDGAVAVRGDVIAACTNATGSGGSTISTRWPVASTAIMRSTRQVRQSARSRSRATRYQRLAVVTTRWGSSEAIGLVAAPVPVADAQPFAVADRRG